MSEPALIYVEGCHTACIYIHHDGNPSHMLPWLIEFNKIFSEQRGDDADYKIAQILRFADRNRVQYNLDSSLVTGWGIYRHDCGDVGQGYEYKLMIDGSVNAQKYERN